MLQWAIKKWKDEKDRKDQKGQIIIAHGLFFSWPWLRAKTAVMTSTAPKTKGRSFTVSFRWNGLYFCKIFRRYTEGNNRTLGKTWTNGWLMMNCCCFCQAFKRMKHDSRCYWFCVCRCLKDWHYPGKLRSEQARGRFLHSTICKESRMGFGVWWQDPRLARSVFHTGSCCSSLTGDSSVRRRRPHHLENSERDSLLIPGQKSWPIHWCLMDNSRTTMCSRVGCGRRHEFPPVKPPRFSPFESNASGIANLRATRGWGKKPYDVAWCMMSPSQEGFFGWLALTTRSTSEGFEGSNFS